MRPEFIKNNQMRQADYLQVHISIYKHGIYAIYMYVYAAVAVSHCCQKCYALLEIIRHFNEVA